LGEVKQKLLLVLAILVAAIPVTVCGLAVWLPMQTNNLRLKNFAENLYRYPLPPDTTVLDQHAEWSKVGNGNNCWYKAQQSMVSTLPREAIEQHYEDVTLPRVPYGQWDEVWDSPTTMKFDLEFDEVQSDETTTFFTLTLYDVGLDVTMDLRCH
jgi:hypothetical protein